MSMPDDVDERWNIVALGYMFAVASLFCLPPGFGAAGLVCGVMNCNKGRIGHGLAQVVLSTTLGFLGMVWGYVSWYGRF